MYSYSYQRKYIFLHPHLHIWQNLDKVSRSLTGSARGAGWRFQRKGSLWPCSVYRGLSKHKVGEAATEAQRGALGQDTHVKGENMLS